MFRLASRYTTESSLRTLGLRTALIILGLTVIASTAAIAQTTATTEVKDDVRTFLSSIVGEWIGTCEQSTDGEPADNKYFHAVVARQDDGSFKGTFKYYRFDENTGKPLHIGDTTVTTTIDANGAATSEISGKGIVLVEEKPKNEEHQLKENITCSGSGSLESKGSGTICVSGMPLGLGKNGKVKDSTSTWTMKDDVLYIDQKLRVGFKALIFSKNFDVEAKYVARRGTDVASLMGKSKQASVDKPVIR